ncbi:hypothetical protein P691DRAFT_812689 [Macrolepiota fuliginosa MF-IS2]|uniref:PH domain-containing protein n=1 Tax=Macrolepiota fuliginosa MF-IS2 TaxID=1400762 RepID=A0A9P6C2T7_9AGAR|nr:hypothetical protein P691DRAFT_812689 [Macrolepiota fuliginosa MF-IS2]
MLCFKNAPPMNIGKDLIDLSKDAEILRSQVVRIRGLGTISRRLWKRRQLTLVENALLIQHPQQHALSQRLLKRIPLQSIVNIERVDLTPACLVLEFSCGRKYHLSFENDAVLYDWQDDIYPRSRLGNFSSPFNFIHEVHLTSDDFFRNPYRLSNLRNRMQPSKRRSSVITSHRTSSELSHTQTHRQSFSPQRASYDPDAKRPIKTTTHKRTNSASSSSTCRFVFDSSIHPTSNLASSAPPVLLEGLYQVKRFGRHSLFALWRSRYVVLTSRTLQIHKTQSSHPEVTVQLPRITDVSQLKLSSRPFVLRLTTADNRRYHISLPNTSDLHQWDHCIASRSKRVHISEPDGFEFHVHVGWDAKSQAFTGLPDEWKTSLEVQRIQEKEQLPADTSSPVTLEPVESPIKPVGPSCPMCYNTVQCSACKLDVSNVSGSGSPKFSKPAYDRRPRPFSVTSGSTLIGDHENHYRF